MAATQGFTTFVIGIGNVTTAQNTLNQFAINGGEPQTGGATSYYAATDEASLEAALSTIVGMVASCTIPLPARRRARPTSPSRSTPSGNTDQGPAGPDNGWSYTDTTQTTIQLNGMYCDGVKNGTYSDVQFLYACNGSPPICIDSLADGTCGDKT